MSQNRCWREQEGNGLDCEEISCKEIPIWGQRDRDEDEVGNEDDEVDRDGYRVPDHRISLGKDILG